MKSVTLFSFIFLSLHLYGQTAREQKTVQEILAITKRYNQTWETLDMNKVAQFHSDGSFRYYRNMKLSVESNEAFKQVYPGYMKDAKSWKMEVSNPVVQVLSKNAAVIGFTGKAELITKDNIVMDSGTGAYTYVWQKINGQWKIVHIHESAK